MRTRLVMGNWKMNGSLAQNQALLSSMNRLLSDKAGLYQNCQIAVCPSFPYLAQAQQLLAQSGVSLGAQDVSTAESGAYTGEVSALMLKDFGCQWVIVGHSERRLYHSESSDLVAQKALVAIEHGLVPVVCVGETLQDREAGHTLKVIEEQLLPILPLATRNIVVAYEPVWAIGTGLTATPEQAQEVHAFIRSRLASVGAEQVQILYGGSVKANNAASLFAMPDIDGALVGGAALNAEEFLQIAAA